MDKKQAYEEKLEAQLQEWNAKIEEIKAKALKTKAQAKIDYYNKLEDLQIKENAVRQKLDEMKKAGSDAWERIKSDLETAVQDLKKALSNPD